MSVRSPAARARPQTPSQRRLAEIQRSRVMTAAVAAIGELGYAQATVGQITARARVSRRTFYELFANREECFAAILDDFLERANRELEAANLDGLAWRERVRRGLFVVLSLLDREPVLARVCVVDALGGGASVRTRRDRIVMRLTAAVDQGRAAGSHAAQCTLLTAEGVVGAALAIVHARLSQGDHEPLTELLGELMAIVVLPYLGAAAARHERFRTAPPAVVTSGGARSVAAAVHCAPHGDPLLGVSMRLTYRTARVLEALGEHPGASNRQVADCAEIGDPGQVSKLLHRLERLGLLENLGGGHAQGEPNKWSLTVKGERVAQSVRLQGDERRAA